MPLLSHNSLHLPTTMSINWPPKKSHLHVTNAQHYNQSAPSTSNNPPPAVPNTIVATTTAAANELELSPKSKALYTHVKRQFNSVMGGLLGGKEAFLKKLKADTAKEIDLTNPLT
jgi:hypothetical protein